MFDGQKAFEWLLDHQIQLANRHRSFLSLVIVAACDETVCIRDLFRQTIRDCDPLFDLKEGSALVMAHTSKEEACIAVDRYKSKCNGQIDIRYSIVSYPADATTTSIMLKTAIQQLSEAKEAGYGAVIGAER